MAHDDSNERRRWGRETQWRGDDAFGGGWGNQTARPQRLGDRSYRPPDDPDYGAERYGPGEGAGYGGGMFGVDATPGDLGHGGMFASSARDYEIVRRDPHYAHWRRRQIDTLDRDYEEYRREHQSRFDREFGAWREQRGRQRDAVGKVREHMEVVGSDDRQVGTVDCARGDDIILTRSDASAGGMHHRIPCAWVEAVEDKVKLNLTAEEAQRRWREEETGRALFERERSGARGPHALNRSFAGTYSDKE